jgi:hypothetical protein
MATIASPDKQKGTPVRVAVLTAVTMAVTAIVAAPALADTADTPPPQFSVGPSMYAYTDSATPDETTYYPSGGQTPVGTWTDEDGGTHTGRVYASFDVSGVNAVRLQQAIVDLPDQYGDCTGTRDLTVRQTAAFDGNTWNSPPALKGAAVPVTPTTCDATPTADVTTMLSRTLSTGGTTLWIQIRVPQAHEADPAYHRTLYFNDVRLQVTLTNQAPLQPTKLYEYNDSTPCSADFAANSDFSVFANMVDRDRDPYDTLTPAFEYWPVADPTAVTPLTTGIQSGGSGTFGVGNVPGKTLAEGTYGWHARVFDGRAYSPWSAACVFTIDHTAPNVPTVSSPDYPEDTATPVSSTKLTGTFLFTANGSADVNRFGYGRDGYLEGIVSADQLGGAAILNWDPPSGRHTLTVWSYDAAGNRSAPRSYVINAA